MENALAAFVTIFLFLFSVLSLTSTLLTSQDSLRASWQTMQTRAEVQGRTRLSNISAQAVTTPDTLEFTYRNDGETKLAGFEHWDVFVEYTDSSTPAGYHIDRLAYTPHSVDLLSNNQWTVEGIYLNAQQKVAEIIEPGIFNPREEMVILLHLPVPVGIGKTIQVTIATDNGVSASGFFTPDDPPILVKNDTQHMPNTGTAIITSEHLSFTDADDPPANLVYRITTPPTLGTLNLGNAFTQLAIDGGLLSYTTTSGQDGTDSFDFTVSDGKTTVGPLTFNLILGTPPVLVTNTGLSVNQGQPIVISKDQLAATNADNTSDNLVYTITTPPTLGTLSLGSSFTQSAINNGLLSYTRTGAGDDSFTFMLTDGRLSSGPYTFKITQP